MALSEVTAKMFVAMQQTYESKGQNKAQMEKG